MRKVQKSTPYVAATRDHLLTVFCCVRQSLITRIWGFGRIIRSNYAREFVESIRKSFPITGVISATAEFQYLSNVGGLWIIPYRLYLLSNTTYPSASRSHPSKSKNNFLPGAQVVYFLQLTTVYCTLRSNFNESNFYQCSRKRSANANAGSL
jgi:hypothetical protein